MDKNNQIHELFKKYFTDGCPESCLEANNIFLKKIFNNAKVSSFCIEKDGLTFSVNKNNYKMFLCTPFWKNLDISKRITLMLWYQHEISKELNIPIIPMVFVADLQKIDGTENTSGMLRFEKSGPCIYVDPEYLIGDESPYALVDIIAHELKHLEFESTEHNNYMEDTFNLLNPYIDPKYDKDYLEDTYNMVMYYFQPTEKVAYSYGIKKLYELYHIQSKNTSVSSLDRDYLIDKIMIDKSLRKDKKRLFGNSYEKVLDWHYLLTAYENDLRKLLRDIKKGKESVHTLKKAVDTAMDITRIKQIISDEKQAAYKKFIKSTTKETTDNSKWHKILL